MNARPSLLWFRLDLRLADQPALLAAVRAGGPVLPVYIHSPEEEAPWEPGAASNWWLHQSLDALDRSLRALDSRLLLRRGPALETIRVLVKESGAGAVYWNRRYEPAVIERDAVVKAALREDGLTSESFNAALLREPWTIRNKSGKPFQVFTPFWKHCLAQDDPPPPSSAPKRIPAPGQWPASLALKDLGLEPSVDWAGGLRSAWRPGEDGAKASLRHFLKSAVADYDEQRDRPGIAGTSRLSPHLHFGEMGPRQIWHAVVRRAARRGKGSSAGRKSRFLAELGWREFAHHLLFHFPGTPDAPLREPFNRFPWRANRTGVKAWRRGRTGYPIVDAGMRELWATGWMHNRVRMIVASFLVKDLLVSWREGARWFWNTLVDADLAQNTLGWQWTAGCGADAAPYFRVFNPTSQGEKFDADGAYVRRWCPELARLPDRWLHQPDRAPAKVLDEAGVTLGKTYPKPVVQHAIAREVALEAFASIRE